MFSSVDSVEGVAGPAAECVHLSAIITLFLPLGRLFPELEAVPVESTFGAPGYRPSEFPCTPHPARRYKK